MKKEILALFLVFALLAVIGCSKTGTETDGQQAAAGEKAAGTGQAAADTTTDEAAEDTSDSSSKLSLDKIFHYGSVKSYEYRLTSSGNVVNIKYSISSDSVDGVDAWLQQQTMTSQGSEVITKMWLEKATQKCLKIVSVIKAGGQEMPAQETPCPTTGANAATGTKAPEFERIGKESVTVPAGTFSADKYEGEGGQYWIGINVPLPIKISSDNGNVVMELVDYS
ncbi:hypothetical protein COV19_01960 [Candidatus Woesearchaeota archaeon CG10_big_fil_rev_8_21_14_0_10_44_13]|nr:MAG: hypothetical protein COV19_01960 [Candidatus Woesearchaeota archaeon CG10_big_fil_rev_8_21_14_0_10_44_13]